MSCLPGCYVSPPVPGSFKCSRALTPLCQQRERQGMGRIRLCRQRRTVGSALSRSSQRAGWLLDGRPSRKTSRTREHFPFQPKVPYLALTLSSRTHSTQEQNERRKEPLCRHHCTRFFSSWIRSRDSSNGDVIGGFGGWVATLPPPHFAVYPMRLHAYHRPAQPSLICLTARGGDVLSMKAAILTQSSPSRTVDKKSNNTGR